VARTLHHLPLSAGSRAVRLALAEKGLEAGLQAEPVWEHRDEAEPVWEHRDAFLALNPAGEVPVLVDVDGAVIAGDGVILEYLDEAYPDRPLISDSIAARVECRRMVAWFSQRFDKEVTGPLVHEKVLKRFLQLGHPDSDAIRAAKSNIEMHLQYIGWLTDRRRWLVGNELSRADLVAAAHLSVVDYLGDVPWQAHLAAKDWYAKIKSRPGFQPLLVDYVPGALPPTHYANLDF
jgi:glutathione S-transferase